MAKNVNSTLLETFLMLQKLKNNTEKYGPVDDKINILIDGGVDLLQGVERSFTDFCFRQSCTQSRKKKRAEKGMLQAHQKPSMG